jgi:hypothetical protein
MAQTRSFASLRMTLAISAVLLSGCVIVTTPDSSGRIEPQPGELVTVTLVDGSRFDALFLERTSAELVVTKRTTFSVEERRYPLAKVKTVTVYDSHYHDFWPPVAVPVGPVGPWAR